MAVVNVVAEQLDVYISCPVYTCLLRATSVYHVHCGVLVEA